MQSLVDAFDTPAYVVLAHPDLPIVDWNRHAERTFRRLAREAIGRPAYEILHPRIHPLARRRRTERLHRHNVWEGRTILYDREQQPLAFNGACWAMTDRDSRKIYVTILRFQASASFPQPAQSNAAREQRSLVLGDGRCNGAHPMVEDAKQHRRDKVAWHLQRLRTRDHLTQTQVAERVGAAREHVNRWENAIWEPSPTYLARLADLFNVEELEFYREPIRC